MKELSNIPWANFDFPQKDMIKFVYESMTAFGDREHWHVNYHDFGVESKLLMYFRELGIDGYRQEFNSHTIGSCVWDFHMHEKNDLAIDGVSDRYGVEASYEDYSITTIKFLKDDKLIKQYIRGR